jgi:hypothetical protein
MIPENINHWNPYSIGIHILLESMYLYSCSLSLLLYKYCA